MGPVPVDPRSPAGTLKDLRSELVARGMARHSSQGPRRSDLMLCTNTSIARAGALACPFDTSYTRMHDVEAGLRLWRQGYRVRWCADALAYELFTKPVAGVLRDAGIQGQYEVQLTEKYPEFKPMTSLARIAEGGPLKRMARKQMAIHARSSEIFLRMVYGVAEKFRKQRSFSAIAKRALQARLGVQHLRGAIEAAGCWEVLERNFGVRTPVLTYHNVGTPQRGDYPGLTIPPAEFDAHMKLLAKMGYETVLPSEWLRWRDAGGALPERPAMLVFDDGYEGACQNAFPVLARYGFSAACTVVTGCIGSTNRWDEQSSRPSLQLMDKAQIVEWSKRGIEFGGHTCSHSLLSGASEQQIEQEILQCKQDLMALLGHEPASFAYPYGQFNDAAVQAARKYFRLAFTSNRGRLHLATDPSLVPRICFSPGESRLGMWCRLRLGRNPFEELRHVWDRVTGRGASL